MPGRRRGLSHRLHCCRRVCQISKLYDNDMWRRDQFANVMTTLLTGAWFQSHELNCQNILFSLKCTEPIGELVIFNSSRSEPLDSLPSNAIWRRGTGSTSAQVMAYCMTAQAIICCLIASKVQWQSFCKRHFQKHFLEKMLNFALNFTKICFQWFN